MSSGGFDMILIATIASIIAAMLVARGNALTPNCIWALSNIVIIWHNFSICEYEMVALFCAYEIIAIYGVYHLGAKRYVDEYNRNKRMDKIIRDYKEEHNDE